MRKGFTLVEMLVVIGIIAVLIGVSLSGYSKMIGSAEKARAQELVDNAMTALVAVYDADGAWPKAIRDGNNGTEGMNDKVSLVLAKRGFLSLSTNGDKTKLIGLDSCGVVTPWATAALKKAGAGGSDGTKVPSGGTVADHRLRYAVDLDGDGIVEIKEENSGSFKVRATACVWCCNKEGNIVGFPDGLKKGCAYSWTIGQTQKVD